MLAGQRIARAFTMIDDDVEAEARHEFKRLHIGAGKRLGEIEQFQRFVRRVQADEGRVHFSGARIELHHRGGDDAERTFRSHEQMFQVVAGVVLLQLRQIGQHAAIGEYDFEAGDEIARIAIGEHRRAAGIGGEIAADGAGAFRRQRQRKQSAGLLRRFLHGKQRQARFHRHGHGGLIGLAHLVHALQGQNHFVLAGFFAGYRLTRNLAADQAGIAALGHDRRVSFGAELQNGGDFRGRAGADDAARLPVKEIARLRQISGHVACFTQHVALADDGGQAGQQRIGGNSGGGHEIRILKPGGLPARPPFLTPLR